MKYDPQLEGLVNEARAVSCADLATSRGWQMKKNGSNWSGPCPKCGGEDRFAIDVAGDRWNCRGCALGGHDAISIIQILLGDDLKGAHMRETFIEACEILTGRKRSEVVSAAELQRREYDLKRKRYQQAKEGERRRAQARKSAYDVWRKADPAGGHIEAYLKNRSLETDVSKLGGVLREVGNLPYWYFGANKNGVILHKGPAMIAVIQWADGRFGAIHRTWIDAAGKAGKAVILSPDKTERLDIKKSMGSLGDGAIRLFTPENPVRIIAGEGIETTLTPYVHSFEENTAYWCLVSLGHMAGRAARDDKTGKRLPEVPDMTDKKCFHVPGWCKEIVFLGDDHVMKVDQAEKKSLAAYKRVRQSLVRAARRARNIRPGIIVKIAWPGQDGDFNDMVMNGDDI